MSAACTIHRLTPEKQTELARRGALRDLVEANLHLVVTIAKRYPNTGHHILDVIQAGNIGLMKAVKEFDPERGHAFPTYAIWHVRRAIRNAPPPVPLYYPHKQIQ